jgi:hypothetical protein
MGNHSKNGKSQKCNEDTFMVVSIISALYKTCLFHNLIAVRKFTPLQAYVVDCSRGLQREETADGAGNGKNWLQQYQFIKIIGGGSFGKVLLATSKSAGGLDSGHELFAITSVPKEDVS